MIDWSDPEEMLGLLLEYVADERSAENGDRDRTAFLNGLRRDLAAVGAKEMQSGEAIARALRELVEWQSGEFGSDPVMVHVEACIEELERINADRREASLRL